MKRLICVLGALILALGLVLVSLGGMLHKETKGGQMIVGVQVNGVFKETGRETIGYSAEGQRNAKMMKTTGTVALVCGGSMIVGSAFMKKDEKPNY